MRYFITWLNIPALLHFLDMMQIFCKHIQTGFRSVQSCVKMFKFINLQLHGPLNGQCAILLTLCLMTSRQVDSTGQWNPMAGEGHYFVQTASRCLPSQGSLGCTTGSVVKAITGPPLISIAHEFKKNNIDRAFKRVKHHIKVVWFEFTNPFSEESAIICMKPGKHIAGYSIMCFDLPSYNLFQH